MKSQKYAKNIQVSDILSLIPAELTAKLGEKHRVDHSIQRLRGRVFFDLLLYAMIRSPRPSTHILEEFYNSPLFEHYSDKDAGHQTRHSSLADRLKTIPSDYFRELFEWMSDFFPRRYGGNKKLKNVQRFDSTLIQISSALVDWGMRVGRPPKNKPRKVQLKVTLGLKGRFPKTVKVHAKQTYLSEEVALADIIRHNGNNSDEMICFDLGLQGRRKMKSFDNEGIKFVTRGAQNLRYKTLDSKRELPEDTQRLSFKQDSTVYLYADSDQAIEHPFRLIEAWDKENKQTLFFITNMEDLTAKEIAEIYRHRWDIEVFFRFLKQELKIEHLLSHSVNGVKVQIYVALMAAMLLTVFKIANNLKGYKRPKIRFEDQLIVHIVGQMHYGKWLVESMKNKEKSVQKKNFVHS
ncbi:IS4 family transposase [uncultured Microscilla sp.]|uniref:IS4 family transposase n=1 Tax=uncultured Microscilla sp. TaxID=432653 RepID=UPI002607FAEC|nr:IS4 family transposase [uncultured Microscilla sp.]